MRALCILTICLLLPGCATFSPAYRTLQQQLQADNDRRIDGFNLTAQQPLPYPQIVLGSCQADPGDICYSDRVDDKIFIDPAVCRADLDDCFNDSLPHECGHWAIAFYHLERPPLGVARDATHTLLWANLMRAFGGNPCKHYRAFCS